MSKVNFYLKGVPTDPVLSELKKAKDKSYNEEINKQRPIIMSVAYYGRREIFSTGKFISIKHWDKATQRIKNLFDTPESSLADREWLDAKRTEVENCLNKGLSEDRVVTKSELYKLIRGNVKALAEKPKLDSMLKEFLEEHKTSDGHSLKENTKKKYKSLITHIKSFQECDDFLSHTYTEKWVEEFRKYLLDKGLNDNSIAKYRAALKTFFKHYKKKGFNIPINIQEIIVKEREQTVITLLEEELRALEDIKLEDLAQDKVRDIFLFECYTGARFGNVQKIIKYDIKDSFWEYISEKTGQEISAPLFKKSKAILQKYEHLDTPLPVFTNQFVNRKIKKIAIIAKLDREIKLVSYSDNKKTETFKKLHEIIATHCARKTFITLSLCKGAAERMVRAVSGHKDERSFRRYVNYNKKHLEQIAAVWDKV